MLAARSHVRYTLVLVWACFGFCLCVRVVEMRLNTCPACKPPNRQHPVRLQPAVVEGTTPIVGTASLLSSHKAAPAAVPFLLPSGLECDSVETV